MISCINNIIISDSADGKLSMNKLITDLAGTTEQNS